MKKHLANVLTVSTLGLALFALPALAQDDPNDAGDPNDATAECVAACKETVHDCRFDAHEAHRLCLEEAGCDLLRDDYRAACLTADRDEDACAAAREALRACIDPCRDATRTAQEACRDAFAACVSDECGVEKPARPHRPGRHGGHHRGPRPFR